MKKLLLIGCLILAMQHSLYAEENEPSEKFDECAEKFLAEFFKREIAFSLITNADKELTKGVENPHYKVNDNVQPILQEYGLLNDDNTIKEGVKESFKYLTDTLKSNPEAGEIFLKKYNIIK